MKNIILLLTLLVAVLGCDRRSSKPNIELIQDMFISPAIRAQDDDPNSMKLPPEGTVPRGFQPYKILLAEEAEVKLKNPFPKTEETVAKGKALYMTYCFPCHGAQGDGKGPVSVKWPAPIPNFTNQRVRGLKDGFYFHLMTVGRGLMGSYAVQIKPEDRWLIVNFIRDLQEKSPVTPQ